MPPRGEGEFLCNLHTVPRNSVGLRFFETFALALPILLAACADGGAAGDPDSTPAAAPDPLPNIVLIVPDDLGRHDVSFHGGDIATPNIDRIAAEGVLIERFYSAPVCSPTRAGLMTGRYPIRFGLMRAVIAPWRDYGLDTSEVTLPEVLARAGYEHRGIFGKWRLGHFDRKYHPLRRGFTEFVGHNTAVDYFTKEREGERDWSHDYESADEEGYVTDLLAEHSVRFVEAHAGDETPFFLYVPFSAPHSPAAWTRRPSRTAGRPLAGDETEWGVFPKDEVSFGNLLSDAGYATFLAGKWQLSGFKQLWAPEKDCCRGEGQTPEEAGFDDYLVWHYHEKGGRYADPLLWGRREDGAIHEGGYGPDLFADFLLGRIEEQVTERPGKPFLAYYPMALVHDPFVPTPDSPDWTVDRNAEDPAYFNPMVAYMDKLVGRVVARLEELGVRDDTLILMTGDNGTPRQITSTMQDGTVIPGGKGSTIEYGEGVRRSDRLHRDGRFFDTGNDVREESPLSDVDLTDEAAAARVRLQAAMDRVLGG